MRRVEAADIDALLPQTQCTRCSYNGCLPYAHALATGEAQINQCPPGGSALIEQLAQLLDRPVVPLDSRYGVEAPPLLAWIDPDECIGCARCLPPCPVDAILGTQRQMHTVIGSWCTGCELCVASCPVDCIHMQPWPATLSAPTAADNRRRYQQHVERRAAAQRQREVQLREIKESAAGSGGDR